MNILLKIPWVLLTIFSTASLVWFLLGSTANFQRSLDLVGTVTLIIVWIPNFIITVVSIVLLIKGWIPSSLVTYAGFIICMIILVISSVSLFQGVNTKGWLTEVIRSDQLKITSDEKYEYRIDLINVFQKNSSARLYVRNMSTGEEANIPVDIHVDKIRGLRTIDIDWVIMELSDVPNRYILYTTKELGIPEEKFEIDVVTGTSRRLK
ncbi:hypothetical protein [Chengkuizengella marina]|uniref:Uncharacterized protein n=1 Tax=Chengkuizengella marina TaxID=2507566 RepID=A0A6N9Q8E9_9BACL|nr:hypothetical protein [Chengkuizengella marina]NBI31020.1 hypothetical protein [Chengkuizengella marina]